MLLAAWRSCGVWVSRRTWRRQTRHRAAYRLHGGLDSSPHEFLDSPRPPGAGDNAGNSTPRGRIEKELNSSDEQTRKHWSAEEWFRSLGVKPGPPHPTAAAENTTLACGVCGKPGVSICAQCSAPNKKKYRRAIAQAHPLQERDPELYKRLDKMSRLPLKGNQKLWDDFCAEIGGEDYYEYMPILVKIVQEGGWRTDALKPLEWLRGNLAKRVMRLCGPDDYGPAVASVDKEGRPVISRTRRPSWPKFDKRNGALTAFATRPYAEFEVLSRDGETISPDEAIEGQLERKRLRTASPGEDDNSVVMPADRDSLRFLGRKTYAEKCEDFHCSQMVYALKHDRPRFDKELARAITDQQALVKCLRLDCDEAEVLAVMSLLWDAGPRMYLKFLNGANHKRVRNAWDRMDRKRRKPDWAALFRQTLRKSAGKRRELWNRAYWANYYLRTDRQNWQKLIPPNALRFSDFIERDGSPRPKWDSSRGCGISPEESLRHHTQMDKSKGLILPPSKEMPPDLDSDDSARPVALGWDLTAKQRALYRSSASKPEPRRKTKLFSE